MLCGLSFGLITQRSQVQILTPLPIARPDRVLPYPAFFVSPLPNKSSPQAAPALLNGRVLPSSFIARGRRRGLHYSWCQPIAGEGATRSRRFISAATVQREPGTTLSSAAAVAQWPEPGEDIAPVSQVQVLPAAADHPIPQNEKGLRANGSPSHSSTPPARKDDYDP